MNASTHSRSVGALRVALAVLVASALVASGQAVAESSSGQDRIMVREGLEYPNPQYPNHKPLRDKNVGSYTGSAPARQPASGFDWLAAGVGAAGMLGLLLLLAAGTAAARLARNPRHDVPVMVHVRDDSPGVG